MGQAYQAGVLAALQLDLGWDARKVDVMIGTSAGAVTGALLRLDTSPFDLASWVLGQSWSPDQSILKAFAAVREDLPPLNLGKFMRPWRLPAMGTFVPVGHRPWSVRPLAILSSMVPPGRADMQELLARHLAEEIATDWPTGLRICAVRRKDGRRVVFGEQPNERTRLASAIAASSSIPGYFAPVTIDGQQYLDGGIHSPTNADLLASEGLDLAIIVSPMSGGAGGFDKLLRGVAQRRLRSEVEQIERRGTKVIVFEPGPVSSRTMGINPMVNDDCDRALQASFFEAGELAARSETRQLLAACDVAR